MNFPIPLFALLAARQANDSPADAGRIALVSMLVRPQMLGLLLAIVMARQAAPATAGGTKISHGKEIIDYVAPKGDLHRFCPSFLEYTRKRAQEFADEVGLSVTFAEEQDSPTQPSKQLVYDQKPLPGARWPAKGEITLYVR
jgi:hypothetical protein